LDAGQYPVVSIGGTVEPGPAPPSAKTGTRKDYDERTRTGRPAARPGEGTSGGAWTAGGAATTWQASAAASVFSGTEVESVQVVPSVEDAYPQVRCSSALGMDVLTVWVEPIAGLPLSALLVTLVPHDPGLWPAAWAWWDTGIWIGHRHTNYPDGSICSFERRDGTWRKTDPVALLLDLHVLWVARHMHLTYLGRWPGRQVMHTAHERLTEHRPGELCGCDSGSLYDVCHKNEDLRIPPHRRLEEFRKRFGHGHRVPPPEMVEWLCGRRDSPPDIERLFSR